MSSNINNGIGTSLFGIGASNHILDTGRGNIPDDYLSDIKQNYYQKDTNLTERHIHGPRHNIQTIKHQIIIILISAMIFVSAVAVYDVIRNSINYFYADFSLHNNGNTNTEQDINNFLLASRDTIISSALFALFCIITSLIFIPLLILLIRRL